ncbi:MAG: DUF4198 domain-containing protein [Vicinamibacteria bacterium]
MRLHRFVLPLAAFFAAGTLFAHETFLAPSLTLVPLGGTVRLDLSSTAVFPIMETAIVPARVAKAEVRLADGSSTLVPVAGTKSLRFTYTAPKGKSGVATAAVSLKPKTLTMDPKLIGEYAEEIGQPELLTKWNARAEPKQWREEYAKHAKAFFRVGNADDESWKIPVGQVLEMVPLSDPTRLAQGEEFVVQLLQSGQPFANFPIVAIFDKKTKSVFVTTDGEGKASFKLEKAGRWLMTATQVRETTKAGLEFESDFATMLVMVRPAK